MISRTEDLENLIKKNYVDLNSRFDSIETSINGILSRLLTLEGQSTVLTNEVKRNTDDISNFGFLCKDLELRIIELERISKIKKCDIKKLEQDLDDQIDRNLRETVVIHGIEGQEKEWEATKILLSTYLEELCEHKQKMMRS